MSLPETTPSSQADLIDRILLRNSVNMLAGAPGVGKTALVAWLLKQFRDGARIFGYEAIMPAKIAFIGADRSWQHSTRLWFEATGYPDIPHYSLQDDKDFDPRDLRNKNNRINILKRCFDMLKLPPGSLVTVDPLAMFLGGNLNDYDTCAVSCSIIRRECEDRGLTLIGCTHSSKQKAEKKDRYLRPQDRILGSTAIFGYTDTQMYLASPEEMDEKFYTFLWAPHHRPAETFQLGRDANGLFVPFGESVVAKESNKVLAAIPTTEEGIGFAELIIITEVSKATVHRNLQTLLASGLVIKAGHGRYRKPSVS